MTDDLRKRRDALRAELAAVERELAEGGGDTLDSELRAELASASEFVTLLDDELRVIHNNRIQEGGADNTGREVLDYIAEPYHAHLLEVIARARQHGSPWPGRLDVGGLRARTSGSYHLWAVPLPAPVAGATMALIGFEATHLQQVERALQDERSVVHSVVQGIPDTMMIVDRDHRITYANHVRYHASTDDVVGADLATFIPEPYREVVRGAIDSVFDGEAGASYETQVSLPAGTRWYATRVGPIARDGEVVRVCLVATDVTEQRRRELLLQQEREALRKSETRFRSLVDNAPDALVIFDAEGGQFLDASASACTLFKLDRERLLQLGPVDLSPPHQPGGRPTADLAREYVQQALREGRAQFEWLHVDGQGRELMTEVHLRVLPDETPHLMCGSVFDIRDRKRGEREQARLREELFQAQKMQAIGQLTGGVAHDFNNLLTVVMGHVELLRLRKQDPVRVSEHADEIMEATTRAASLTQQLLAFGRRQPLKPRRVDLGKLISDMERLLARTLGETVVVRTLCEEALWHCEVDPTQLENAILNLAINSRDAMPHGGTLTLSSGNHVVSTAAGDSGPPPGRYVALTITDDGAGMPPEVASQAFEPFFTTKEVGRGSGMGLSMVYGFVKQSGGHVDLSSAPGEGTRVSLLLPAAECPASESDSPPQVPTRSGHGELILVVEDEPAVRSTTVKTLHHLGYRTVDASDASGALQLLDRVPDVALVLTDVVLAGGENGVRLAQQLREACPRIAVMLMSGYPKDVAVENGQLAEDMQLLSKPFTQTQLASALQTALERGRTSPNGAPLGGG
ncbi:MAG: PAS domain S-box protein [Myxococcales bacterium]|jgi:PAS domain S-box-containing protein